MVLGHCGIPEYLLQPIYMFHMPIFFVISGYLYDDRGVNFTDFLKRKARSLLYPYFVLGTLVIVYNTVVAIASGHNSLEEVGKRIAALMYGNYIWENNALYIGVLWFVVALFCSEVLYYAVMHLTGKCRIVFVAVTTVVGIFFSILNMYQKVRLPWCLDIAFIAYLFFFVGAYIRDYEISAQKGVLMGILGFIVRGCNLFFMKELNFHMLRVDMLYMNYGILPLFLISASLISIGLIGLTRAVYASGRRFQAVEHMDKISILIMVIHLYVIQLLGRLVDAWAVKFLIASMVAVIGGIIVEKYMPWVYRFPVKK